MRSIQWAFVALQFSFAVGFPGTLRGSSDGLRVFGRQIISRPPDVIVDDNCRPVCTALTCSGGLGVCPARRRRRSVTDALFYSSSNISSSPGDDVPHTLGKRAFNTPITGARSIGRYIMRQLGRGLTGPDGQFGAVRDADKFTVEQLGINWNEPDATVSRQQAFQSGQAIQWGTDGLMGCTMLLIVSARAVWMGHLFEVGAFCGHDNYGNYIVTGKDPATDKPYSFTRNCQQSWNEQVVNPLLNADVTSGGTVISQRINPSLFNQPGDNTQIIFMTPRNPSSPQDALYGRKVLDLHTLLRTTGGIPNARALVFPYTPLDPGPDSGPTTPAQVADNNLFWNSYRGCALFQFDGVNQWRAIFEDMSITSDGTNIHVVRPN